MNKLIKFFILFLVLFCFSFINFLYANDFIGSGTKTDPFLLNSYASFEKVAELVASGNTFNEKYFKITKDIEFKKDWGGIGILKKGETEAKKGLNIYPFSGVINGDNKKLIFAENSKPLFNYVRNANIENVNLYCKYFDGFALVDNYDFDYGETGKGMNNAKMVIHINNVNLLEGTNVKNGGYIGVNNEYAFGIPIKNEILIENCKIGKNVKIGVDNKGNSNNQNKVGSFAGEFIGKIKNCESYATIYGNDYVGGIVALESNAMGKCILENNKFCGIIVSKGKYVGGILGAMFNKNESAPNGGSASILNNQVTKDVIITGKDYVGGLVGHFYAIQNWSNSIVKINNNIVECKIDNIDNINYIGSMVGCLRSINKNYEIIDNYYGEELKNLSPFGKVEYVDTNKVTSGLKGNTTYINTEDSVDNLPVIIMGEYGNMTWKKKQNRSDDPLGVDIKKLARPLKEK